MIRREFISLLGGAAAWPLIARAQQPAMPVIGFLNSASPAPYARMATAFRQGLSEAGYIDGRNAAIEYRWANGQYNLMPALAADLVRRQVTVIATGGIPAVLAAKAATTTIPIVFSTAANPVDVGLVASLSRPGGNLTGVTNVAVELGPKQLELMHEMVPKATVIALLVNPTNPNAETQSRDLKAAARTLGLELHALHASTERELDMVFAHLAELQTGGLVIGTDPFFTSRGEQLAALTLRYAVPAIYEFRQFAAAGGLMSYGGGFTEGYRLVGVYTGGFARAKSRPTCRSFSRQKSELALNLTTAKALGITFPLTLLGRRRRSH